MEDAGASKAGRRMNYDIDRDAAMERCFQAGKKAGAWGSPADANPYRNKSAFHREAAAWASGHTEGYAEYKRRKGDAKGS